MRLRKRVEQLEQQNKDMLGIYNLNKNELADIIYEALMTAEGDFHGKELDEAFKLVKQRLRETLLEGMDE